MSPWLLLFLACALALYLLVILPLSSDENLLGRRVVVAPTLRVTLQGHHTKRKVVAVVRRWERGWNGTTGEQRVEHDGDGDLEFPPATIKSWAARVVPHKPVTEQWLHVVLRDGEGERLEPEAVWTTFYLSYEDRPLELKVKL